jgi:hypothetical protein
LTSAGKKQFLLPAVEMEPTQLKPLGFVKQHPIQLVQFVVNSLLDWQECEKTNESKELNNQLL